MFFCLRPQLIFIIILVMFGQASRACDSKNLLIPIFNHPPHFITPNVGNYKGDMVTYVEKYIFKNIKTNWKWKKAESSFKRIWTSLMSCEYQLGVGLAPIAEIKYHFLYSSKPFAKGVAALAVPKKFEFSYIKSAKDLKGVKVGYFQAPESFLPKILKNKTVKLLEIAGENSFERSVKMLKFSRVGAVFYPDAITLKFMLKNLGMLKEFKVIEINSPPTLGYFVIPKKLKGGKKLMDQINKAMSRAPLSYNRYSRSRFN